MIFTVFLIKSMSLVKQKRLPKTKKQHLLYLVWSVVVERWGVLDLSTTGVFIWRGAGVVIWRDPLHSTRHFLCHVHFIISVITWEGGYSETMIALAIPVANSDVKTCQKTKQQSISKQIEAHLLYFMNLPTAHLSRVDPQCELLRKTEVLVLHSTLSTRSEQFSILFIKAVHSDAPAQDTFIAHFNMTHLFWVSVNPRNMKSLSLGCQWTVLLIGVLYLNAWPLLGLSGYQWPLYFSCNAPVNLSTNRSTFSASNFSAFFINRFRKNTTAAISFFIVSCSAELQVQLLWIQRLSWVQIPMKHCDMSHCDMSLHCDNCKLNMISNLSNLLINNTIV